MNNILKVASISLALCLGSGLATAQDGVGGAVKSGAEAAAGAVERGAEAAAGAVKSGAEAAASAVTGSANWTAENVSAAMPFGSIDVGAAGTTPNSVGTWVNGRSDAEKAELTGRCNIITNRTYSSRYPASAATFCRNLQTAQNSAGKAAK